MVTFTTYLFLVCHGYIGDILVFGMSWLHWYDTCFWFVMVTLVIHLFLVFHIYIGDILFLVCPGYVGDILVSGLSSHARVFSSWQ